jgi:hypothetical protein
MADNALTWLTDSPALWSRAAILARPCPIPRESGVYGWFFRSAPPAVPTNGCVSAEGAVLLYVGISPRQYRAEGVPPSTQNLRTRIRYHLRGNAEGSTLRLTLGCLLEAELGLKLQRVGSGRRLTFGNGEQNLSDWLHHNALVTWLPHPSPWDIEERALQMLSLPLNLDRNESHSFQPALRACHKLARERARADVIAQ